MTTGIDTGKLPSYERPPVTEVACSVLFPYLEALLSPHIGLLWTRFQTDYPICKDVAPIVSSIKLSGDRNIDPPIELTDIPPLPRAWFMSEDKTRIIQLQRDRFAHNWRKLSQNDEYPGYDCIIKTFQSHLETLDDFLEEAGIEKREPLQYELSYVNQVMPEQPWLTPEDIGKVFPDFSWRNNTERLLPAPQSFSGTTIFELPDELGRLRAAVKTSIINEHPVLLFEITVLGIGTDTSTSRETLQDWFDRAHEWIVRAFNDLTSEEMQIKNWQRRM